MAASGFAIDLVGPVPAESAFRIASKGGFDAVIAMYHDHATIPMKLLGFGEAVNISLGLPITGRAWITGRRMIGPGRYGGSARHDRGDAAGGAAGAAVGDRLASVADCISAIRTALIEPCGV